MLGPLLILLAVGAALAWGAHRQRLRRLAHEALHTPLLLPEGAQSLADLFWALGATPLALELMIRRELVPRDGQPPDVAHRALRDDIAAFGGWQPFLDALHEVLGELEEEARRARLHRNLPHLALPSERLLPGARADAPPIAVDGTADPRLGTLVESLFSGRLEETLARWWGERDLRKARRTLDARLRDLARTVIGTLPLPALAQRLHAMGHARSVERDRIERLCGEHRGATGPWRHAVQALLESALVRATDELDRAEEQAARLVRELHEHAAAGQLERVGWLLYVNRRLLQDIPGTTIPVALEMVDRAAAALQSEAERARQGPF